VSARSKDARPNFARRRGLAAAVAIFGIGAAAFFAHDLAGAATHSPNSETAGVDATTETTDTPSTPAASATSTPLPQAAHLQVTATAATAQITALAAGQPAGAVSIAATNLSTGATFTWGTTSGMTTASVIKLDTLETLLLQHQQSATALSSWEDSEAQLMIEQSDNDAEDDLWNDVGGDAAVTAANQVFGLTSTVAGTDDYWGLTTTSATDQVTLLRQLVGPSALNAASQAYALSLMRSVESDQAWGVSVVADAGTPVALKNGWLSIDGDDDLWAVNSVGIVSVHGQYVAIAIMTQHQPDESTGISLVEALAAATVTAVS